MFRVGALGASILRLLLAIVLLGYMLPYVLAVVLFSAVAVRLHTIHVEQERKANKLKRKR